MELSLGKNEKLVKSWDYALGGGLLTRAKRKVQANLTLTNKRVIYTAYNDISLERQEISITDVKTIGGNYKKNPKLGAILKIVFGGLFTCLIIGILFKGFGLRWIKEGIDTLKGTQFELKIITEGCEGSTLEIAAQQKFIKVKKTMKVTVDRAKAKDILDELGALIIDVRDEAK